VTTPESTPDDAVIDADLALSIYDYDPRDTYPHFSHQDMREAWIAGYETGRLCRGPIEGLVDAQDPTCASRDSATSGGPS
jgi:hypothetical protein